CDSKWRVERATGETALSATLPSKTIKYCFARGSASGGVYREPQYQRYGFTMAEILLSLTIIGVVAAITLPSLTGNINERTWNTQRKALYARMSQAISLMPALNGYGTLKEASSEGASDAVDNAAETFLTAGLSKVLKINNICADKFEDCGIVTSFTNMGASQTPMPTTLYELNSWFKHAAYSGSSYSTLNTKAAAFETQNGESIIAFYNQSCRTEYINQESLTQYGNNFGFPEATMCLNFIYDLNGSKGPNTAGKDIGIITVFNATDSIVVAPMPSSATNAGGTTYNWQNASKACTQQDSESRLPNIDELSAMLINKDIINLTGRRFWSGTVHSTTRAWESGLDYGGRASDYKTISDKSARCVKR
ncbi:MAG: prepilin-type N-terminal cleavage/methylation domain-containing protein, partial [Fusobacterium sp.]|nr:prepilin-type N-terminal cleavage/methylation domain-containing protein [Fusobacterium sp.]